jgi:hypothetical protein
MNSRQPTFDGLEWCSSLLVPASPVPAIPMTVTIWATPESRGVSGASYSPGRALARMLAKFTRVVVVRSNGASE